MVTEIKKFRLECCNCHKILDIETIDFNRDNRNTLFVGNNLLSDIGWIQKEVIEYDCGLTGYTSRYKILLCGECQK